MHILFDIGGTNTRIARTRDMENLDEPIVFNTPEEYEVGFREFVSETWKLASGEKIDGITGGVAGPWSRKTQRLIASPNLPQWIDKPLKEDLEREFGCIVNVENDAAMAALGEAHYGAGKGFEIVVYFTISTGIGGARIVKGEIDERIIGFEPGHQIVDMDVTVFPDAQGVDLESMIGGRWIEARTGKKPFEIDDKDFWEKVSRVLAVGLNNTIVHWSPDVVILGGSMMKKIGVPFDRVEAHLRQIIKIYPEIPPLKKSKLGDLGGLYGALAYINQQSTTNPDSASGTEDPRSTILPNRDRDD